MTRPEVWLENLADVLDELEVPALGVLHLGAHDGREVPVYRRLGFRRIVLVEPLPDRAEALRRLPDVEVEAVAIGQTRGPRTFYRTPHDEASSTLRPMLWPSVPLTVDSARLEDLDLGGLNVLVADLQGGEVDALSSGPLCGFDVLVVETAEAVRYHDGANRESIDLFLSVSGWKPHRRFGHHIGELVDTVYRRR